MATYERGIEGMKKRDFLLIFLIAGILGVIELWLHRKAGII
jgi:hypothetical protein